MLSCPSISFSTASDSSNGFYSKGMTYFLNLIAHLQFKVKFDCVLALGSYVACIEYID